MKIKFKPIHPDPNDIAHLRRQLRELIARMKSDYDRYLKPLVEKMSDKEKRRIRKDNELALNLIGDAEKYLTAYDVARRLHILKSRVIQDAKFGRIKGAVAVNNQDGYIIPESSVQEYGVSIGKLDAKTSLIEEFNKRLQNLVEKYNSLISTYQSMSEKFTEKMYQRAKKQFMKQFPKDSGIDIIKQLSEKGLKDAFYAQVGENVNLIKTIPSIYFGKIQQMVIKSTTGGFEYEGGLQKAIIDLTGTTRQKAVLIARDQSMKAISTFTQMRYQNIGSDRYIWHNSDDKRVAGNPKGLYPNIDPKSKYHGNHWDREGKVYYWTKQKKVEKGVSNPPPDGNPGMAINCRCWAEPIFDIEP